MIDRAASAPLVRRSLRLQRPCRTALVIDAPHDAERGSQRALNLALAQQNDHDVVVGHERMRVCHARGDSSYSTAGHDGSLCVTRGTGTHSSGSVAQWAPLSTVSEGVARAPGFDEAIRMNSEAQLGPEVKPNRPTGSFYVINLIALDTSFFVSNLRSCAPPI